MNKDQTIMLIILSPIIIFLTWGTLAGLVGSRELSQYPSNSYEGEAYRVFFNTFIIFSALLIITVILTIIILKHLSDSTDEKFRPQVERILKKNT